MVYRVECRRPDRPSAALVGDFQTIEEARAAALPLKDQRRGDILTITSGEPVAPEPPHENGHWFTAHSPDNENYHLEVV